MYELYTDQTMTFPDGSTKTKNDLEGTPYAILLKVPCVIDVAMGITSAYSPLGPLADMYGISVDDHSSEEIVTEINAARARQIESDRLKFDTYSSVLASAKITARSFTDEQAIEVPDLYPEFEFNYQYKKDDRFQYNGSLYKVNQDHTSQEQWVPGETGTESLYTNLMLNDSGYQIWKQPTGAHDAYNKGDIVEYNGELYKSLIDGNAYSPDAYPAGWEKYTEPEA